VNLRSHWPSRVTSVNMKKRSLFFVSSTTLGPYIIQRLSVHVSYYCTVVRDHRSTLLAAVLAGKRIVMAALSPFFEFVNSEIRNIGYYVV
jgi:hypothetical protein